MKRFLRTSVIATAVLATALGVAGPAAAATPLATAASSAKSLAAEKKEVTLRIDRRLAALQRLSVVLGRAKEVQYAHRTTLALLLTEQTAGLKALRVKVSRDKNDAAVKEDARIMVNDFRVFILTSPKVRVTAAIDTELVVIDKLKHRKGADIARLNAVQRSLDGKVGKLLAIQPGPDGNAIKARVKAIREAAKNARNELKELRKH